jgi:cysteine synthase A
MERYDNRRIRGLSALIGNTPLLAIDFMFQGRKRTIHAKAENLNMTGSIKDRMALHIMAQGYAKGLLKPGDLIAEATSGNTGISFSAIGRALGHPVAIFMPDWMSTERINLIRCLGAKINLITREEGGFQGSILLAEKLARSNENVFLPRQFSNQDNSESHFTTTGPEIWWQLRVHCRYPDAFVAGVGTGGTIMGVGRYLRQLRPAIKLYPLEPANSPTLSTGHKVGKHRIQGISDEFIPPIVDLNFLDRVISVDDGDAILMAQKLAGQLGLGVGISSGANFIGALLAQNELERDAVVVTIFPDDNKKYLSTDLFREEPSRDGFLAPEIELLSFQIIKRVCYTCCNPEEREEVVASDITEGGTLPFCPRRVQKKS